MLDPQLRIPQIIPQVRKQDNHLVLGISPQRSQDTHRNVLHAVEELYEVERANLLQLLVLRPRPRRDGVELMFHLGEAGVAHPAL